VDGNIIRDYLRMMGCIVALIVIGATAIGFTLGALLL